MNNPAILEESDMGQYRFGKAARQAVLWMLDIVADDHNVHHFGEHIEKLQAENKITKDGKIGAETLSVIVADRFAKNSVGFDSFSASVTTDVQKLFHHMQAHKAVIDNNAAAVNRAIRWYGIAFGVQVIGLVVLGLIVAGVL